MSSAATSDHPVGSQALHLARRIAEARQDRIRIGAEHRAPRLCRRSFGREAGADDLQRLVHARQDDVLQQAALADVRILD